MFLTPCKRAGFVIKLHVFPASADRWPHVVAFCSDSLSLVCWLVEHSCAPPLPSTHTHTHAHTHAPLHKHTGIQKCTYTHTFDTLECWWSNIGVGFDIGSHRRTRPLKKEDKLALGIRARAEPTPTTRLAPSNHGRVGGMCRAEKNKSHWGLTGDAAGGFESRKFQGLTASLTLNRLSDQTYVFVFAGFPNPIPRKESCPKLAFFFS